MADFTKYVQTISDQYLDRAKCWTAQKQHLIRAVKESALEAFPQLGQYENLWPVTDVIKMHLKKTSNKQRRAEGRLVPRRVTRRSP